MQILSRRGRERFLTASWAPFSFLFCPGLPLGIKRTENMVLFVGTSMTLKAE